MFTSIPIPSVLNAFKHQILIGTMLSACLFQVEADIFIEQGTLYHLRRVGMRTVPISLDDCRGYSVDQTVSPPSLTIYGKADDRFNNSITTPPNLNEAELLDICAFLFPEFGDQQQQNRIQEIHTGTQNMHEKAGPNRFNDLLQVWNVPGRSPLPWERICRWKDLFAYPKHSKAAESCINCNSSYCQRYTNLTSNTVENGWLDERCDTCHSCIAEGTTIQKLKRHESFTAGFADGVFKYWHKECPTCLTCKQSYCRRTNNTIRVENGWLDGRCETCHSCIAEGTTEQKLKGHVSYKAKMFRVDTALVPKVVHQECPNARRRLIALPIETEAMSPGSDAPRRLLGWKPSHDIERRPYESKQLREHERC